jgi:hypothetical protein
MTMCSTDRKVWPCKHTTTSDRSTASFLPVTELAKTKKAIQANKALTDRQVPTVVRSCIADDDMLMCLHATDARTFVPVEYTNTVGLGPSPRQAKLCFCNKISKAKKTYVQAKEKLTCLPTVTRSCIEALRRSDRCVPSAKRFGRLTFIMIRWNPVEFI